MGLRSLLALEAHRRSISAGLRGPADRDGLRAGVEVHALGAVDVGVAQQRLLPAAERVVGHRGGDGHVDAHHAGLDVQLEAPRVAAVIGEDGRAVAELTGVDQLDGLRVVGGLDDAQHRPEDLLLVDGGIERDLGDDRGTDPEAVLVAVDLQSAAVEDHLRAALLGVIDEPDDAVAVLGGDDGTHLDALVEPVADLDLRAIGGDELGQLFPDATDRDDDGQRHAALTGRTEGRRGDVLGSELQVRVGQDDGVVVCAAESLDALAVGDAGVLDDVRHRGGADEGDRVDARVGQDIGDQVAVTSQHVEHAVGQPGFLVEAGDDQRRGGGRGGGLQDERVAGGDGDGVHPHRHHDRKVEGADARDHADGLADGVDVDAGGDVEGVFALQRDVDAAGEVEGFAATLDLADGVGVVLAVLLDDGLGQLVLVGEHQFTHLEHDGGALGEGDLRPLLLRFGGDGDGVVEVSLAGGQDFADGLAGGWVLDGDGVGRLPLVGRAVYPVGDCGHVPLPGLWDVSADPAADVTPTGSSADCTAFGSVQSAGPAAGTARSFVLTIAPRGKKRHPTRLRAATGRGLTPGPSEPHCL